MAIISVLAAIAVPAYRQHELRSEVAEGLLVLGDAQIAVNDLYSRWGRMPADNSEAGFCLPDALREKYVRSVGELQGQRRLEPDEDLFEGKHEAMGKHNFRGADSKYLISLGDVL
ncbi:MAG: hypothetical protein ABI846_00730 [Rudaea sp.]